MSKGAALIAFLTKNATVPAHWRMDWTQKSAKR